MQANLKEKGASALMTLCCFTHGIVLMRPRGGGGWKLRGPLIFISTIGYLKKGAGEVFFGLGRRALQEKRKERGGGGVALLLGHRENQRENCLKWRRQMLRKKRRKRCLFLGSCRAPFFGATKRKKEEHFFDGKGERGAPSQEKRGGRPTGVLHFAVKGKIMTLAK